MAFNPEFSIGSIAAIGTSLLGYGMVLLRVGTFNGVSIQRFETNALAINEVKADVDALRSERDAATNNLREEIRSLNTSISAALQDNARAIGRLEGANDLAKQIAQSLRHS